MFIKVSVSWETGGQSPKDYYVFKNPQLDSILSQFNPVQN
jgi:hypothetical protein